ncbi:MAG: PP2C family protein-serine/threonine phosphatase [Spongiibacter sp.]
MIEIVGGSHVGKRKQNEDRFVANAQQGLALVADGMGGAEAGDVAAQIVADSVPSLLNDGQSLAEAISTANTNISNASTGDIHKRGMGSTVVAASLDDYRYQISWIGDSRAYLWTGELQQLTRDHSYVEGLIAKGEISPEEAVNHTKRNVITRALGHGRLPADEVPRITGNLGRGEYLLLCSDGLNDILSGAEMAKILSAKASLKKKLEFLIAYAVKKGGSDNITAVLVCAGDNAPESGQHPAPVSVAGADGSIRYL